MELPVADIFDAGTRLLEADSTRDHILISSKIHRDLHVKLSRLLDEKKAHDSCTIYMTTRGGDPNAGYRIARCLRHHYDHVRLVVPSLCKSAGTLIAIGADDLAIEARDAVGRGLHREAAGRPALFATTRQFLDDLGIESLDQLPELDHPAQQASVLESLNTPDDALQPGLPMDGEPEEPPADSAPDDTPEPIGT